MYIHESCFLIQIYVKLLDNSKRNLYIHLCYLSGCLRSLTTNELRTTNSNVISDQIHTLVMLVEGKCWVEHEGEHLLGDSYCWIINIYLRKTLNHLTCYPKNIEVSKLRPCLLKKEDIMSNQLQPMDLSWSGLDCKGLLPLKMPNFKSAWMYSQELK